ASRRHSHHLQPQGVAADQVQRYARRELGVAVVKAHAAGVHAAHHADHVLDLEGAAEFRLRHVAAGGVAHLEVLQVESGRGKQLEIADVVVMQVSDDNVFYF